MFLNSLWWLREGRPAYRSANNVICIYEEFPISYLDYVIEERFNQELCSDSPNTDLLARVQEDRLGVTADGLWAMSSAHERIQLTRRGEVRLVSRERSRMSEPPTEPLQAEAEPLRLLPRPDTVTFEERAF